MDERLTRVGDTSDAGDFASWRERVRASLRREVDGVDVPCGTCTACCTSSQFVHVEPDETETLARIPEQLLFPAPGAPKGHLVLGYDEHGCCPMLQDGACSIYEHRPRTCRSYDCRVFAAAGVEPDQPLIAARVREWRFSYGNAADRAAHDAVIASAAGGQEANPTQRALRAVAG